MKIELNDDEALVLFDWLQREDKRDALPTEHQAEKTILWSILCQLEKVLVQPFRNDYDKLVAAARDRVVEG